MSGGNKYLGPGVSYSPTTRKYQAKLGVKIIGHYNTLEQAAESYNDQAKKLFTFPVLNPNHVPIEEIVTKEETIEVIKKKEIVEEKIEVPTAFSVQGLFVEGGADISIASLQQALALLEGK